MKKVIVGSILALVISAVTLYAQQSVAGSWVMSVQGMSLQLVMAQDGEKISGTLESPHGEIRLIGEFAKGKLTLSGASMETHPVQFTGTATLGSDGSLAGTLSVNQMEMSFTAARAPAK